MAGSGSFAPTQVRGGWWATTTHLRPSSRARVEGILDHHLLPRFGAAPLTSIGPSDIRAFVADLVAAGLAPATVRKVYNALGSIFRSAVTSGVLARSPCIGVSLPGAGTQNEQRFLSPGEIGRLADAVPARYRALVLVGGYGGLRFGELAGLTVERFDALRSRLTVLDSITEVGGHLHRGATKSGRGRVVSLPRFVSEELARHLTAYPRESEGLIFTGAEGGPLRRTRFRERVWVRAVEAAGLQPLRFHDPRHTAAALAIKVGAHPRAIMERLGHRSITTTLNQYGHLFPELDEALAERLDEMGRSVGEPGPIRDRGGTAAFRRAAHAAESTG